MCGVGWPPWHPPRALSGPREAPQCLGGFHEVSRFPRRNKPEAVLSGLRVAKDRKRTYSRFPAAEVRQCTASRLRAGEARQRTAFRLRAKGVRQCTSSQLRAARGRKCPSSRFLAAEGQRHFCFPNLPSTFPGLGAWGAPARGGLAEARLRHLAEARLTHLAEATPGRRRTVSRPRGKKDRRCTANCPKPVGLFRNPTTWCDPCRSRHSLLEQHRPMRQGPEPTPVPIRGTTSQLADLYRGALCLDLPLLKGERCSANCAEAEGEQSRSSCR